MESLANISFGAPWVLLALALLPAIWFLLRVIPPLPKRVVFPPLALLLGLRNEEQTPAGTPWWLMLLRLMAAAALIVALAEPQIGRALELAGNGPIVLFVDNGWTAAPDWKARQGLAEEAVRLAARQRRPVAIVTTADKPDTGLMDAGRAGRAVRALTPKPWLADRSDALAALAKVKFAAPEILWLSDGVDDGHARATAQTLSRLGHLRIFAGRQGPLAVTSIVNTADGFEAELLRTGTSGTRQGAATAFGDQGQILGTANFRFDDGKNKTTARLALPLEMRNATARIAINGEDSAGAVHLLDRGAPRRAAGLVSASNPGGEEPLLSGLYYLQRALAPYADTRKGTISEVLSRGISVLILSDIGKIAGDDHARVKQFVENGGLLIRFAGERMAGGTDDLVPVELRSGGRYLGGALAWAAPQHLAPFPDNSPFGGLSIPGDVSVSRQILAEPSVELASHTWARLTDGTPMVTAARRGKGWIVLFHVTAGPGWSTLPLSGLYVSMLQRLLSLSAGTDPHDMTANASLPATFTLDGFGHLAAASAEAQPVSGAQIATIEPSRLHPPGLYGTPGAERALNAASGNTVLLPFGALGTRVSFYAARASVALQAPLLLFAALLLLADFAISLVLRGYAPRLGKLGRGTAALLGAFLLLHPGEARADDAFDLKAALDTRLAYVITGVPDTDAMSKAGLTGLGAALAARTSYVPKEPMGVDLAKDDLALFPL
ncbi:MAG TPA: BatA domain-containing protein, partial [Rhizomicrobium sp.]